MKKNLILALFICCLPLTTIMAKDHKPIAIEKQWQKYNPGKIHFTDKSPKTEGSKIYHQIIKDKNKYIRENALRVLQTLYFSPEDVNIPKINDIYYTIEDYDGISEKSGWGDNVAIRYSTRWIEKSYKEGNRDKLDYETRGVIYHELTHAYQLSPMGCGEYDGKSVNWSFIEGLADGVRVACGCFNQDFKSKDRPRNDEKRKWESGYRISGYFLYWLSLKKDPDFIKKFNASAATLYPWSWDAACRYILGDKPENSVANLWNEYKHDIGDIVDPVAQIASPTLRDAYKLALWTVDNNTDANKLLKAGGNYGGEWTRDISINSWNAVSMIRPDVAEHSLWSVTNKKKQ